MTEAKEISYSGISFLLDPNNEQKQYFIKAAGARRYCYNQAVSNMKKNYEAWAKQKEKGVEKKDRIKPLSSIDLQKIWMKTRP